MIVRLLIFTLLCSALIVLRPITWDSWTKKELHFVNKTHTTEKFDIVAVGDSRVNIGIVPSVIENKTGLRVLNFGYSAAGLTQDLINDAVDKLDPNGEKMLLVGISPASLGLERCQNESYYQWKNLSLFDRWKVSFLNEYMGYFDPIKPIDFVYAVMGRKQGLYTEYYENGWRSVELYPRDTRSLVGYTQVLTKDPISLEVVESLLISLEECSKEGIEVYAFRVPSIPEMWQLENDLSGFDTLGIPEKVERTSARWINIQNREYESVDASHLDLESSYRFTKCLIDSIEVFRTQSNY